MSEADLAKIPSVEELSKFRGKKNGEVKMFKRGKKVDAYGWNGSQWDLIGEVTG